MPHRFKAPDYAREVFAPSGPKRAGKDGIIELPDDASLADINAMRAAGCTAVGDDQAEQPQAPETEEASEKAAKAKPAA